MEAMQAVRQTWTDDRFDHLEAEMKQRFEQVDRRFEQVDKRFDQVDRRFDQVDRRFEQVDNRFEGVEGELGALRIQMREENVALRTELRAEIAVQSSLIASLNRTLMQTGGGIIASVVAAILISQL